MRNAEPMQAFGHCAQIIFAPLVLAAFTALVTSELVDCDVAGLSAYGRSVVRCPLALGVDCSVAVIAAVFWSVPAPVLNG